MKAYEFLAHIYAGLSITEKFGEFFGHRDEFREAEKIINYYESFI